MDDLKRQPSYSDAMEELVSYLYEVTKSEAFEKGKELAEKSASVDGRNENDIFPSKKQGCVGRKIGGRIFAERMAKAFAVAKKLGQAVNVNKETELTLLEEKSSGAAD